MPVYIGCDIHPYSQTVAWCDLKTGEIRTAKFDHKDRKGMKKFYGGFKGQQAIVGVEACGAYAWFEELLREEGIELQVGDAAKIRKRAESRHKTDRKDAEHIMDLLMTDRFPTLWRRSSEDEEVLKDLRHRHGLVKHRTLICNRLQAIARDAGLGQFKTLTPKGRKLLNEVELSAATVNIKESLMGLLDQFEKEIKEVEKRLEQRAKANKDATRLMTHTGIGPLTSLCLTHTLGDVKRFQNSRQITAYVGLDPLESSSGEKVRLGSISKAGSALLRFLLVQAAQSAVKKDARLRSFYHQIARRRGKAIAIVATARKLCTRAYIMLRDEIDYEEFCRRGTKIGLHEQPGRPAGGKKPTAMPLP